MMPWEGDERLVPVLHKIVDFFFCPPPLVFAAYLGRFSNKYSTQNVKDTNYPRAVYLKADELMGKILQLV